MPDYGQLPLAPPQSPVKLSGAGETFICPLPWAQLQEMWARVRLGVKVKIRETWFECTYILNFTLKTLNFHITLLFKLQILQYHLQASYALHQQMDRGAAGLCRRHRMGYRGKPSCAWRGTAVRCAISREPTASRRRKDGAAGRPLTLGLGRGPFGPVWSWNRQTWVVRSAFPILSSAVCWGPGLESSAQPSMPRSWKYGCTSSWEWPLTGCCAALEDSVFGCTPLKGACWEGLLFDNSACPQPSASSLGNSFGGRESG